MGFAEMTTTVTCITYMDDVFGCLNKLPVNIPVSRLELSRYHRTCTVGSVFGRLQKSCNCCMNGAQAPAHWLFADPDVTPTAATN